jgi:hypothetical protein
VHQRRVGGRTIVVSQHLHRTQTQAQAQAQARARARSNDLRFGIRNPPKDIVSFTLTTLIPTGASGLSVKHRTWSTGKDTGSSERYGGFHYETTNRSRRLDGTAGMAPGRSDK